MLILITMKGMARPAMTTKKLAKARMMLTMVTMVMMMVMTAIILRMVVMIPSRRKKIVMRIVPGIRQRQLQPKPSICQPKSHELPSIVPL